MTSVSSIQLIGGTITNTITIIICWGASFLSLQNAVILTNVGHGEVCVECHRYFLQLHSSLYHRKIEFIYYLQLGDYNFKIPKKCVSSLSLSQSPKGNPCAAYSIKQSVCPVFSPSVCVSVASLRKFCQWEAWCVCVCVVFINMITISTQLKPWYLCT